MEKSHHFHRAVELNFSVGSECLRSLTQKYLRDKGVTLVQHIQEPHVRQCLGKLKLFPDQKQILNGPDPQLNAMDVSLIIILLLYTFPGQLTAADKSFVEGLREKRNELSHQPRAELNDDTLFKESCHFILQISKSIDSTYKKNVVKQINELRRRELVNTYSSLDRIHINNGVFMLKLVEGSCTEQGEKDNELLIKFGLTKWIKQLCRGIDAAEFLNTLKSQNIISNQEKREFEQEYSNGGQIRRLVLYMVNCASKDNLYKMCRCLRQVSPQLADIVENSECDGQEIERYLNSKAKESVRTVLQKALKISANECIPTEEVHIYVEETVGDLVNFEMVKDCLLIEFPSVHYTSPDCSFSGVTWERNLTTEIAESEKEKEPNFLELSCEEFADYIGKYFNKRRAVLEDILRNAILDESLSATTFVAMTQEQMEIIFTPYLGSIKYGEGMKMDMQIIQSQIRKSVTEVNVSEDSVNETLRIFDSPVWKKQYKIAVVKASTGNLLVPRHEFVNVSSYRKHFIHFITKDVLRFTAACMNGRQNGTIHFGIVPLQNGLGKIIGIPKNSFNNINLNEEITTTLTTCFGENISAAKQCIRPVQIVPVESGTYVIEIDVVPFSCHLNPQMFYITYPPKGCQCRKYFMFDINKIVTVSNTKLDDVCDACVKLLKHREYLEDNALVDEKKGYGIQSKLKKLLTRGNRYVKDELIPIIISGRISDSAKEMETRQKLDIDRVFSSAELVLDFDSSIKLRDKVEGSRSKFSKFLVKTAENLSEVEQQKTQMLDKADPAPPLPTWLYCNGNDEIQSPPFRLREWMRERSNGIKASLCKQRKMIPKDRGILIFLVFDTPKIYQDPLFEIARDALLFTFRGECLIISTTNEHVAYLKQEVSRTLDDSALESCFVSGLAWDEVSTVMKSVFRANEDVVCRLPCSNGHLVEMTAREKGELKLSDIEILSGEQCIMEEETMGDHDRKAKRRESQELFYKGDSVSWWNFYYRNQVGKRDQFETHKKEIKELLSNDKGDDIVEIHEIEHHPGAGGSTLGRHLLWELSQFKGDPDSAYRCCVVHTITEETVAQLDRFRSFKDIDDTRPFIVLIDNESEESIILLKTNLYELAYKMATPGKLFCLLILINRMSITYEKRRGKHLLKHQLTYREKNWFEDKFEEMERKNDYDVNTLIAFNCMRNSFDEKYIHETIHRIMQGITTSELEVLKCLALISSYESDTPIPQNIFDRMMNKEFDLELITRQPFGIKHHIKELDRLAKQTPKTWNVNLTDAMQLLLTKRDHESFYHSGVCIVSKLLAKAVLFHIMDTENISLEEVVIYVLELVEQQMSESNPMSKQFVRIVCSLFKTRQPLDGEKGEAKLKFSDLVLELEQTMETEKDDDARQRVIRVMQRCVDITDDAMVGQQLARFNIHIKEFEAAEKAIIRSISKVPQSSYLLDTHGQIFKSKMEYMFESSLRIDGKIPDDTAAAIVDNAFTAILKFREGQSLAIKQDEDKNWICFRMEVITWLTLLEKFSKFSCYCDRRNFLNFLNDDNFEINGFSFENIVALCPTLDGIRSGREEQRHVDTSLRSLQERFYQVKHHIYPIHSDKDVLLLKLRERFERFYGTTYSTSRYKFLYGIGLKPLQHAKEKDPDVLEKRVKEAEENLRNKRLSEVDERDFLVYLGTKIITLSNLNERAEELQEEEYTKLLKYSKYLVDMQTPKNTSNRPYLESYLYYAMLHWPSRNRLEINPENLSGPVTYFENMGKWETAYDENFFLKSNEQIKKNRPKNYFALGKGSPGNDIIDLESIRRQWKEMKKENGRSRRPVFRDNFWKEGFVVERLERLAGIVDGTGHQILHKVEYSQHGTQTFRIKTYYPCSQHSNRPVTFVLGFTWRGPTALDVDEKDRSGQRIETFVSVLDFDDQPSSIETVAGNDDEKDNNRVEGHIQGACGGTEEVVRDHKQGACGGTEVGVIDHVLSACGGTEDGAVDNCKEKENARHRESVDEYKSEKGLAKINSQGQNKRPPWMKPGKRRRHRRK